MGNKIKWAAADSDSSWTHARVYRGTSKDPDLMSQIVQQDVSDKTYYDTTGTSVHYYAITFYDNVNAIESGFSFPIQTTEEIPTYTTINLVRNQTGVSDTTVLTDAQIEKWILFAEAELDADTGRTWKTPSLYTERFSTRARRTTKTSLIYEDSEVNPYQIDFLVLEKWPVVDIQGVWFIENQQTADFVFSDDGGSFTDNSDESKTMTGTPFYAFAATPAISDHLYIGKSVRFMGVDLRVTTAADDGVIIWEYYNGSSWTSLDLDNSTITEVEQLYISGKINFFLPRDWQLTTINSEEAYWIRARVTTAHGTSPEIQYTRLLDVIGTEINLHDIDYDSEGGLYFIGDTLPDGTKNTRVDYRIGAETVPQLVQDATTILTAIRGFIAISGGSYDSISTYSVGSLSVSVGEQYVNIREELMQLKDRYKEILKKLGKRHDMVST